MEYLVDNWRAIFSGIGTAAVVAVAAWLFNSNKNKQKRNTQVQRANAKAGSQVVQAGRDASVVNIGGGKERKNK